jgi:hypothetical protein
MTSDPGHPGKQAYDRWFLLGERRNELLALHEVQQYGRDSFGDPDHVSIHGLKPHDWYARGVRILVRTAVECTPDRLADPIGRDVAAVARAAPAASPMVVDLFAGSGNTLSWIKRHTGARRAIGTRPPVPQAVDVTTAALGRGKLLFAIHVCETVEPGSLAEVTARFPWSAMKAYDINAPGQKIPGCSLRRGAGCPERCESPCPNLPHRHSQARSAMKVSCRWKE